MCFLKASMRPEQKAPDNDPVADAKLDLDPLQ